MKETKRGVAPVKATQAPVTYDWGTQQVTGFEKTTTEDLGVPFLVIVQKGSPEVDKTHKDHATKKIEGVGIGDIINTVTRQVLYSDGNEPLIFTPCAYEKLFVEWKPRSSGGGFVRSHSDPRILNECTRNEKNQDTLPNGNLIQTTAYFFGFVHTGEGELNRVVIGMSSTQLKKARAWLNMMMSIKIKSPSRGEITPPMFSHRYAITTQPESNQDGGWYGWKIEGAGMNQNPDMIGKFLEVAQQIACGNRPQIAAPTATTEEPPM